jgi:hypothetical protein
LQSQHLEGDSDLLYELITLFLIEEPKQLGELSRLQAVGNLATPANAAQAIKGTIAIFMLIQQQAVLASWKKRREAVNHLIISA